MLLNLIVFQFKIHLMIKYTICISNNDCFNYEEIKTRRTEFKNADEGDVGVNE